MNIRDGIQPPVGHRLLCDQETILKSDLTACASTLRSGNEDWGPIPDDWVDAFGKTVEEYRLIASEADSEERMWCRVMTTAEIAEAVALLPTPKRPIAILDDTLPDEHLAGLPFMKSQYVTCSARELQLLIAHLAELRMPTLPNLSYPHKCVSCDKRVHKNNSCGACPDCVADRRRSQLKIIAMPNGHLYYELQLEDQRLLVGCMPRTSLKVGDVAYAIVRFDSAARKSFTFSDYADTPNAPHEVDF